MAPCDTSLSYLISHELLRLVQVCLNDSAFSRNVRLGLYAGAVVSDPYVYNESPMDLKDLVYINQGLIGSIQLRVRRCHEVMRRLVQGAYGLIVGFQSLIYTVIISSGLSDLFQSEFADHCADSRWQSGRI